MKREDQIHLSYLQIWNAIDTPVIESTNIYSEKFKQSSESQYNCNQSFCLQHPQKKAKYILLSSEGSNQYLCTKCAVVFAQQGHKIQIIEEDNAKKKQTDSFIDQLLQTKVEIENIHSNFLYTEANIKSFYNNQQTHVIKTFGNVEKQLLLCKSEILFALTQSLWSGIQTTNQLKVQAKQIEHQLGTYINDIKNHYDKIVQMSTLPFNQIMGGYSSKLFKLQQYLKELQENKVTYLHYDGKINNLDLFLKSLSLLNENDQSQNQRNHESTRSSSEQKTCKSVEKEKRNQANLIVKKPNVMTILKKKKYKILKLLSNQLKNGWKILIQSKEKLNQLKNQQVLIFCLLNLLKNKLILIQYL